MTIPAGGSIAVNHTVAASYDFEAVGAGTFTFETTGNLQVFEGAGSELTSYNLPAASVDVTITDDVAKRTVFPESEVSLMTSTPVCDDVNGRKFLASALSEARAVAGGAAANIRQQPNSGNFATYFENANRDEI